MTETPPQVIDVCRNIALASHDGDIQAIAAVVINSHGEPELLIGFDDFNKYRILSGLVLMTDEVSKRIRDIGSAPLKDRE